MKGTCLLASSAIHGAAKSLSADIIRLQSTGRMNEPPDPWAHSLWFENRSVTTERVNRLPHGSTTTNASLLIARKRKSHPLL